MIAFAFNKSTGVVGAASVIAATLYATAPSVACQVGLEAEAGTHIIVGTVTMAKSDFNTKHAWRIGSPIQQHNSKASQSIPPVAKLGKEKVTSVRHAYDICKTKAGLMAKYSNAVSGTYKLLCNGNGQRWPNFKDCNKEKSIRMPSMSSRIILISPSPDRQARTSSVPARKAPARPAPGMALGR